MEELDVKKAQVTGKMQKRDESRLAELQKRKDDKELSSASNEKTDFFTDSFNRAKIGVEQALSNSKQIEKSKLPDHFDSLILEVQKMQKFLSDSTMFLPSYDIQKSNETISSLNSAIKENRDLLIPKKKFAFKSKTKATDKPKSDIDMADGIKEAPKRLDIQLTEKRFTDLSNQTLSKTDAEIHQSDVALARLTDCTVKLIGTPSTLHMNNLRGCTILCGPVSSSIFVDDCENCTVVSPCQQLRVHNTTHCKFYLHVTSRAIIEDSNGLLFAPYNLNYEGLDKHYEISGLDKQRNAWDDVDDFNWLASDAHSPNWNILPTDQRTIDWDI